MSIYLHTQTQLAHVVNVIEEGYFYGALSRIDMEVAFYQHGESANSILFHNEFPRSWCATSTIPFLGFCPTHCGAEQPKRAEFDLVTEVLQKPQGVVSQS